MFFEYNISNQYQYMPRKRACLSSVKSSPIRALLLDIAHLTESKPNFSYCLDLKSFTNSPLKLLKSAVSNFKKKWKYVSSEICSTVSTQFILFYLLIFQKSSILQRNLSLPSWNYSFKHYISRQHGNIRFDLINKVINSENHAFSENHTL